jgi:hypothetical protein
MPFAFSSESAFAFGGIHTRHSNDPALPQSIPPDLLGDLVRKLNSEELKKASGDVFGSIYEYFLTQFANQKAHDAGELPTSSNPTTAPSSTQRAAAAARSCSPLASLSSATKTRPNN